MQRPSLIEIQNFVNPIEAYELLLLPFYLLLIYFFTYHVSNRLFKNSAIRPWILPALTLKLIGAVAITLIYIYYYKGGDTCLYYNEAKLITQQLFLSPIDGIKLLFYQPNSTEFTEAAVFYKYFHYAHSSETLIILKLTAIVNIFSFNSFLITSILYGYFSFWCILLLANEIIKSNSNYTKPVMIALFFVPNNFIWNSGILKDTVCFACFCLIHVSITRMLVNKEIKIQWIVLTLIGFYILTTIRMFIAALYIPCLMFYFTIIFRERLEYQLLKTVVPPFILILSLFGAWVVYDQLSSNSSKYNINQLLVTAKIQRDYLLYVSQQSQGSQYNLGDFDMTIENLILKIPESLNVSLFRPYLWESRNIITVFSALEAFLILLLTLYVLYKRKISEIVNLFKNDKQLLFYLVFSIIYLYVTGITSYNFGSLIRYKVQGYVFFVMILLMLYYYFPKTSEEDKKAS
jgi:hypothetical protein